MTETSGRITRTRQEAEKLAADRFPKHSQHWPVIASVYEGGLDCYCDGCLKTGTIVNIEFHQIVTQTCHCVKFHISDKKFKSGLKLSNMPLSYWGAEVESWNDPGSCEAEIKTNARSMAVVTSYVAKIREMKRKGYGLLLCGPNGVGKTYLACAIGANCIRSGFDLCYYTMPKIISTVVGGWHEKDLQKTVYDIERADFLVIDDLDKAYTTKTGLEISVLDNLFRERLQNNRPMILTSNKTPEQIATSHGGSVASMLTEHCATCVFLGSDYRKGMGDDMMRDILA